MYSRPMRDAPCRGLAAILFMLLQGLPPGGAAAQAPRRGTVVIDFTAGHPLATISPELVWGGALDGHERGEIAAIYTPGNLALMNSAGFGPVSYRLRTELAIETWHWNAEGRWSDSVHQQGYWVSSDRAATPIEVSYGYRLPRRGRTIDEANNDGYSRIDDGDAASFWKSNPYLDPRYTGTSEAEHPQWLVVDLGGPRPIGVARLAWGVPYPQHYLVDFWEGDQTQLIDRNPAGRWRRFSGGSVTGGRGGDPELRLAQRPVTTRFVRLTLFESSHTAVGGTGDARDSLGFALREIFLGTRDASGRFRDQVKHGASASRQSQVLVSSTDPWHRASDRDEDTEQPGFDRVFQSGLTHGLPMLVPVGVLFDTPENAVAELRFLRARGYPVERLEMGEEPDGQRVTPEDYAALYLQFARALHAEDPTVTLGGPSWQDALNAPVVVWPERSSLSRPSWIGRFLDYLGSRGRTRDFGFFSFEWYPFEDACRATAPQLARAPGLLVDALDRLRAAGLSDSIPWIMTEYGYSAYAGPAEVETPGALFNADVLGSFFTHGGSQAFVYGYEPGQLLREPHCSEWGNNMLFLAGPTGRVRFRMPTYYAARLLTRAWADSAGGPHEVYRALLEPLAGNRGADLVSVYALHRPDARWGLLLINRDPSHAWSTVTRIRTGSGSPGRPLSGPVEVWQYGRTQYRWRADGERGSPARDDLPLHRMIPAALAELTLPAYSITVVVGS